MSSPYEIRRDTEAALAAQRELGPDYSDSIAAGLAERVEHLAAMRTAELRHDQERDRDFRSLTARAQNHRFVTALVSLGTGVPITAIAATNGEQNLLQVAICWAGIVGVNAAQALGARSGR